MPNTSHTPTVDKHTPQLSFTFAEEDYPLVLLINKLVGGIIRPKLAKHIYILTISNIFEVKNIVSLMNGHLRTPKIVYFNDVIDWLKLYTEEEIFIYEKDTSPILNNP
jgi:hypothetical protein